MSSRAGIRRFLRTAGIVLVFTAPLRTIGQAPFKKFQSLLTVPESYVVSYAARPPVIDGDITDSVWRQARWTENFQDIEGDVRPRPYLQTNVKMLWSDSYLYIAARINDPGVWAYQRQHDDIVFFDNDFEVFLDPNNTTHQYFEIEYNALNTVFDLFLNKPYRNGGSALINWNAEGLRSAVKVQGTLNNPADTDKGWTIEMAIPFKAISIGNNIQVPGEGTLWRINFSRVEWDTRPVNGKYVKFTDKLGHNLPEHNWVWSPQGVINMHYPERWGYLLFTKIGGRAFSLPYAETQKRYLWLIYYQEKDWFKKHGVYLNSLKKLGFKGHIMVNAIGNTLRLEASGHQFMAFISDGKGSAIWSINQEGLVRQSTAHGDE